MTRHPRTSDRSRSVHLVARVAWVLLPVTVGACLDAALAGRSAPVGSTATVALWAAWFAGLVGLLVPTATTLTLVRMLAPVPCAVVVTALVAGGPSAAAAGLAVAGAVVAGVSVSTAEIGRRFVQGSSYGAEERFPLRPPAPVLLVAVPVVWLAVVVGGSAGALLVAAGAWPAGLAASVLAAFAAWTGVPRLHSLSRRWLVVVPTGLVVHDPVGLAETAMFPRAAVAAVGLAAADTEAADLTAAALGTALEIGLTSVMTVVLAASPDHPSGRALHVRAVLVAPTRPGAVLATLREASATAAS